MSVLPMLARRVLRCLWARIPQRLDSHDMAVQAKFDTSTLGVLHLWYADGRYKQVGQHDHAAYMPLSPESQHGLRYRRALLYTCVANMLCSLHTGNAVPLDPWLAAQVHVALA